MRKSTQLINEYDSKSLIWRRLQIPTVEKVYIGTISLLTIKYFKLSITIFLTSTMKLARLSLKFVHPVWNHSNQLLIVKSKGQFTENFLKQNFLYD